MRRDRESSMGSSVAFSGYLDLVKSKLAHERVDARETLRYHDISMMISYCVDEYA